MNQAGADLGLQLLDLAAHRVGGHAEAARRRSKAVGPYHLYKEEDVVQVQGGITAISGFHSAYYAVFPRNTGMAYPLENGPQIGKAMTKVLVLYYSSYGHIETMANAVAEGARSAGATVDLKRVPETAPADVAKASHFELD